MDRATIDRYRGYSRARSGPWDTHYVEMAEKTVLKQLLKRLPKSASAPPEPPPELEMLGYDLVAPDGLEGVINNPALQVGVQQVNEAMDNVRAEGQAIIDRNTPAKVDVAQVLDSRFNSNAATGEIIDQNRKCRRRPMTTTTRRFRWRDGRYQATG